MAIPSARPTMTMARPNSSGRSLSAAMAAAPVYATAIAAPIEAPATAIAAPIRAAEPVHVDGPDPADELLQGLRRQRARLGVEHGAVADGHQRGDRRDPEGRGELGLRL